MSTAEPSAPRSPSPIGPLAIAIALALPILGLVLSRREPPAEAPRPAGDEQASAQLPSDPEPYGGPTDPPAGGQPLPSVGAPQARAAAAPAIIRQHTSDKPTWMTVALPPGWTMSAETQPSARLRGPGPSAAAGQAPEEPIAFLDMQASTRPIPLTADPSAEGELTEDTVEIDGVTATRSLRQTEGSDMLAVKGQAATGAHFLFTGRVVGPRGPAFDERRAELDAALASVRFVPDYISSLTWEDSEVSGPESGHHHQYHLRHPQGWTLGQFDSPTQLVGPEGTNLALAWHEDRNLETEGWSLARPLGLGDTIFGRQARELSKDDGIDVAEGVTKYLVRLDGGGSLTVTATVASESGAEAMAHRQTLWYILRWSNVTESGLLDEPAYP